MASAHLTPHGDLVLILTDAEAQGLLACADEGASGLFADAGSARDYIGNKTAQEAAQRALDALGRGAHLTRTFKRTKGR